MKCVVDGRPGVGQVDVIMRTRIAGATSQPRVGLGAWYAHLLCRMRARMERRLAPVVCERGTAFLLARHLTRGALT
jgi:hypothetical protein